MKPIRLCHDRISFLFSAGTLHLITIATSYIDESQIKRLYIKCRINIYLNEIHIYCILLRATFLQSKCLILNATYALEEGVKAFFGEGFQQQWQVVKE